MTRSSIAPLRRPFFIFLILLFAVAPGTFAQWLGSPGPITYNTGNVGIGDGTTPFSPRTKLDIFGGDLSVTGNDHNGTAVISSHFGTAFFGSDYYNNGLSIDPIGRIGFGTIASNYAFEISSPDNSNGINMIPTRLRIANTTSTGVNTPGSYPVIEVLGARGDGNNTFEGRLALGTRRTDGNPLTSQTLGAILFGGQYGVDQNFQLGKISYPASIQGIAEGSFTAKTAMPTGIAFFTGSIGDSAGVSNFAFGTERMRITNTGNVGIGTSAPGTYKLAVEGIIGARKVVVTQASWADYVFDKKYKLPSLPEVEKFISLHQHLPGIPSATTVKEKGLDLAETQAQLLKKIEELTLYSIDQDKRLNAQQKEIDELKALVKKIAGR